VPPGGCKKAARRYGPPRPDVKAILVSGYDAEDAADRFTDQGLAGFIQKPFQPDDLIAKFREVLAWGARPGERYERNPT
jgi:DNA-binding NtrC family response regulator